MTSRAAVVDAAAWAAAREYAAAPHTAVEETSRLRWLVTGAPYEVLNGVYWAGRTDVPRALEPFRQAEVPMLWHAGPTTARATVDELTRQGLRHYADEPGMVLELGPPDPWRPLPDGFEIRRVGTEAQLRAWVGIWAGASPGIVVDRLVALRAPSAFGVGARTPHLLGVLEGEPVASAAVWVGRLPDAGDRPVAWLEHVATRTAVRRRGFATALTRAALDVARRRGASRVALTASPSAVNLYASHGFEQVCTVSRYLWLPRWDR